MQALFSKSIVFLMLICLSHNKIIYYDSEASNSTQDGTIENPFSNWANLQNALRNPSNYTVLFKNTIKCNILIEFANSNITFRYLLTN